MSTQNDSELDQLMEQIRSELGSVAVAVNTTNAHGPGRHGLPEVMRRVRAEVMRRREHKSDGAGRGVMNEEAALPRWQAVAGNFAPKTQYLLADLLKYSDEDFVVAAYRAILRRSPDEAGLRHYLSRLRDGHTSKVEVLGDLRWSAEGKARGVHIDGLLLPYTLWNLKRKRVIGPLIRWIHAFVRLGGLLDRHNAQMAQQNHEVHAIGCALNELSGVIERQQAALREQLDERPTLNILKAITDRVEASAELTVRYSRLVNELSLVHARVDELERQAKGYANDLEVRSLGAAIGDLRARIESLAREHASEKTFSQKLDQEMLSTRRRVEHMEHAWTAYAGSSAEKALVLPRREHRTPEEPAGQEGGSSSNAGDSKVANLDLDPLYAAFEDRFRGDRALVRRRAEPYLKWITEVGAGTSVAPVLDIGCGRGEWLELLREHGLVAKGIDLNRVFADICRGYGLDIIEGDAISALRAMPSASIGAITSMHLVEHLGFEQMITLLDEALRVLMPGGLIVLETPNPENLTVGSHTFYMDPTHRNPIPPEALRWIVEARGFYGSTIERLKDARELNAPPLLSEDLPGAPSINALLATLHAAPDYAILARKP